MVAVLLELTPVVVAVNVAVVLPAATVTFAGMVTSVVSELVRVTTSPPVPAGPLKVTVPVELMPPSTVAGAITTLVTVGRVTVKVAFWLELL
jgi:hypothetical protein